MFLNSTDKKSDIQWIREVTWNTDLHGNVARKLVSESHGEGYTCFSTYFERPSFTDVFYKLSSHKPYSYNTKFIVKLRDLVFCSYVFSGFGLTLCYKTGHSTNCGSYMMDYYS